jgi:diguanylate cyclase (GGDEF)-like protein
MVLGPRGPHPWRELGLQVCALGLIAAYVITRAVTDRQNRRWLVPAGAWMTCMALGNLLVNGPEGGGPPTPISVSTVVFLFAGSAALATVVTSHHGTWRRPRGVGPLIEPVVSTLAVAALFTSFLLPEAMAVTDAPSELAAALLFPVLDLVGVAIVAVEVAWSSSGARSRICGWLALGLLLFLSADWAFALGLAGGGLAPGSPFDALWVLGCAAVGLMAAAGSPGRPATESWGVAALGVCLISAAAAVSILAIGTRTPLPLAGVVLAVACVTGALIRLLAAYLEMRELVEVHELARTDELTGLGNRRRLYHEFDRALAVDGASYAVLLADLDGFKAVNDRFGHALGDELLVQVGDRLRRAMPAGSILARLGGDEFVAVVADSHSTTPVELARCFAGAVAAVDLPGGLSVEASVGVVETARFPGADRSELLHLADLAMYLAKTEGTVVHRLTQDAESVSRSRRAQPTR